MFDSFEELLNKIAYYQGGGGVNEPTPKKKKYKSEVAIVMQPRFKEPLFKNYDLYDVPGVDGPAKHGPGEGLYQNMSKYKSVNDFLNQKHKRNKHKYKSDDSYIQDDGSITKSQKKSNKIARRMMLLSCLVKTAIDFPSDDLGSDPILGESGSSYADSIPIGGQLDEYLTMPDFEGKSPDKLDFSRDYTEGNNKKPSDTMDHIQSLLDELNQKIDSENKKTPHNLDLSQLLDELTEQFNELNGKNQHLNAKEPDLYGLPDGIDSKEDLEEPSATENPYYGITDSGNTLYDKISY
jgi:hypothetical protein